MLSFLHTLASIAGAMEVDRESNGREGSESDSLRLRITELEQKLQDEKHRYKLLQSDAETSSFLASKEVDRHRRECSCLRETVARLKEDCGLLRVRELKDQDTIKGFMEEIDAKEREFKDKYLGLKVEMRDLECAKRRAEESLEEVKRLALKLLEDGINKKRNLESLIAKLLGGENAGGEVLIPEKDKGNAEMSAAALRRKKRVAVDLVDSDGEGEDGSCKSNGQQHGKKRCKEEAEEDSGPLRKSPDLSRGRGEPESIGAKETSAKAADAQIPAKAAAVPTRLVPTSNRPQVGLRQAQVYNKWNLKNQSNPKGYTGRIASAEELHNAKMRAEALRNDLKSSSPSFIKTMNRSHVSGGFWFGLPADFCRQNLSADRMPIILEDENGSRHEVNYIGDKAGLSGGWKGFALSHKLEIGDVLIFELKKPTKFKVYIVKAIPEKSG